VPGGDRQRFRGRSSDGRAILIIEDEAVLARNLAVYLERLGYEPRVAGSALQGLAEIENFRPEVVLLDHHPPGMSCSSCWRTSACAAWAPCARRR
jgi:DNA-binding response OmpR family regulator